MRHIEFFHTDHFDHQYYRISPSPLLEPYIEFFWETRFEGLWKTHPKGFSDVLFPNIGYTYLINLGTPFTMQIGEKKFKMKSDGFLPRHVPLECYHQKGNRIFGIKFKISPIVFEKKINFSEYREYIFPLSYLVDPSAISKIKKASSFDSRVRIANDYFESIINKGDISQQPVSVVMAIMKKLNRNNQFNYTVNGYAREHAITPRTLQRYFEKTTSISTKKAIQIIRIRKATMQLLKRGKQFSFKEYGYYDHSHFYKHLKQFLNKDAIADLKLHLALLERLHK